MTVSAARCAWLTTLRNNGTPHTTPIWFLLRDDTFWIASSTVNVKVRNLQRRPSVSLAIDGTGATPCVAEGNARVRAIDARPELIPAFASKYDGWDATDETQDGPRVLVEIAVDRWLLGP